MTDKFIVPFVEPAKFTKFSPKVFDTKAPVDRFFLMLSLVFNDLKTIGWIGLQIRRGIDSLDPATPITPYAAELQGLRLWASRQTISILHELMELVIESKPLLDLPLFSEITADLEQHDITSWVDLVEAAGESPSPSQASQLRQFLVRVRNTIGYHYHHPKGLGDGYSKHFFGQHISVYNEFAYASFGDNFKKSRFYFADAATEAYIQEAKGDLGIDDDAITEAANSLADAAIALVAGYLKLKQKPFGPATFTEHA